MRQPTYNQIERERVKMPAVILLPPVVERIFSQSDEPIHEKVADHETASTFSLSLVYLTGQYHTRKTREIRVQSITVGGTTRASSTPE